MKRLLISAAMAASVWATQASAALTTFSSYTQKDTGAEMSYTASNMTLGTSGYQTYLNVLSVQNILTTLSFTATTSNSDVTTSVAGISEVDGFNGSFSFTLVNDTTIANTNYTAGSVLFTGVFSNASLVGSDTAGSILDTTKHGSITYTSPAGLLVFQPGVARDLAISLTQIDPGILTDDNGKLEDFSSVSSGNFSSDPAPVISGIPEASTWAMMLIGFGAIGWTVRRRNGVAIAFS